MILLLTLLALLAGVATWPLGSVATALPSFGVVAVLLAARRAPPGRHRWIALLIGFLSASGAEGAFFLPPLFLLLLGSLAAGTRTVFPLTTPRALAIEGTVYAALESTLQVTFGARPGLALPADPGWIGLSVLLTGVLHAACDLAIDATPRLRHALERP